jgi:hypothetical protein
MVSYSQETLVPGAVSVLASPTLVASFPLCVQAVLSRHYAVVRSERIIPKPASLSSWLDVF